ncbi:MAG: NAD(P)-dependent oxidoreductase [Rhodobacteraceae bacterium]|nr:NAD(P)-dependent oxidoreductase [Paracoccaceae bacterium]
MHNLAFIGLGVMGYPMAGHLAKAGHEVTVYNRSSERAKKWRSEYDGQIALTPADAAEGADFVMCCVGNDDDLREVTIGKNGAFSKIAKGSIFVDHTTVSERVTKELFDIGNEMEFDFIDAPISGGQAGAENGMLSIMCGGDEQAFNKAKTILETYSKICKRIGKSGAGQQTKMCNQIAIAGLVQGLSEALYFAEKAGLDGRDVVEVISQGAAGSWQMENRYETMLDDNFDHGFAVDWMRKDLEICLETSDQIGANLPVTALVNEFYKDIQKLGGGRWDTSSLISRLRALEK